LESCKTHMRLHVTPLLAASSTALLLLPRLRRGAAIRPRVAVEADAAVGGLQGIAAAAASYCRSACYHHPLLCLHATA
jgi:hypothetical protein